MMKEMLPPIDPEATALLVMDYQPLIIGMLGESEATLARVAETLRVARTHGTHVGYVRVAFDDGDYDTVPPHSRFAPVVKTLGNAFHSDSPGTAVHGDFAPQPGDIVVRKRRVSAFSTTDLDRRLKERGVVTLLLAGIATSGVVLSTLCDAVDRDYQVFVVSDACADQPDVHAFLTAKLFPTMAKVVRIAELSGLFRAPKTTSTPSSPA
jgi:nicotinamidase-related amidase